MQIEFGDPRAAMPVMALQGLRGSLPFSPGLSAVARVLPSDLGQSFVFAEAEGMEEAIGLSLTEIGPVLSVTAPPDRVVLTSIAEGAAARMVATLGAAGHDVETRGGLTLLSRGEDYDVDIDARDPRNIFGGLLGMASRFAVTEGVLAYANATPRIEELIAGQGPSLAEHPPVAAMLSGLEAAAAGAGDLADALAIIGGPGPEVMVADLVNGAQETGLLILPAANAVEAEALAASLSQTWRTGLNPFNQRPFSEMFDGPVTIMAHPGPPASVTLRRSEPRDFSEPFYRNLPADRLLQLVMSGAAIALVDP